MTSGASDCPSDKNQMLYPTLPITSGGGNAAPAAFTPGRASTRAINSPNQRSAGGFGDRGSTSIMSTPRGENPRSSARRPPKLLTTRPAPMSRTTARAIWSTRRAERVRRECLPGVPWAASLRASSRLPAFVCRMAGMPHISAVKDTTPAVNAATGRLIDASAMRGMSSGPSATMARVIARHEMSPSTPPTTESVSVSRIQSLPRSSLVAPSAIRIECSRRRKEACVSMSAEMLAQAMRSNTPTAAKSNQSADRTGPNRCSRNAVTVTEGPDEDRHDGRPELGAAREIETAWHHTDDRVEFLIQDRRISNDVRISAKSPDPCVMAQHDHTGRVRHVVFRTEGAAEHRPDPKDLEERCRNGCKRQPDRLTASVHHHCPESRSQRRHSAKTSASGL